METLKSKPVQPEEKRRPVSEMARVRMIEEQLASRGITDSRVLDAMDAIPRSSFVEGVFKRDAYREASLPIGEGQTISQPFTVARMTQALELRGRERVLEIGTGSGYQTAILAQLCEKVFSIERISRLAMAARKRLEHHEIFNVVSKIADGTLGWAEYAPFDAIIVTASFARVPAALLQQLVVPGGRLVMPIGVQDEQQLYCYTSRGPGLYESCSLGDCRFVPLVGKYGHAAN